MTSIEQHRRRKILRTERADRQWEAAHHKRIGKICAGIEMGWKGSEDDLFLTKLNALVGLHDKPPPGYGARQKTCLRCDSPAAYSDEYDSSFCPVCNRWLESACDDPACLHCALRPRRPLRHAGGREMAA